MNQNILSEHHHRIQHIEITLDANFNLNLPQKSISHPKHIEHIQHHHQIQHTGISQGTNFHLKQTVLIFWTMFAQNGCLLS